MGSSPRNLFTLCRYFQKTKKCWERPCCTEHFWWVKPKLHPFLKTQHISKTWLISEVAQHDRLYLGQGWSRSRVCPSNTSCGVGIRSERDTRPLQGTLSSGSNCGANIWVNRAGRTRSRAVNIQAAETLFYAKMERLAEENENFVFPSTSVG